MARYADGWMSNQIELSMFQDYQGRLRDMLAEEGRDPKAFKTALYYGVAVHRDRDVGVGVAQRPHPGLVVADTAQSGAEDTLAIREQAPTWWPSAGRGGSGSGTTAGGGPKWAQGAGRKDLMYLRRGSSMRRSWLALLTMAALVIILRTRPSRRESGTVGSASAAPA